MPVSQFPNPPLLATWARFVLGQADWAIFSLNRLCLDLMRIVFSRYRADQRIPAHYLGQRLTHIHHATLLCKRAYFDAKLSEMELVLRHAVNFFFSRTSNVKHRQRAFSPNRDYVGTRLEFKPFYAIQTLDTAAHGSCTSSVFIWITRIHLGLRWTSSIMWLSGFIQSSVQNRFLNEPQFHSAAN